MQPGVAIRGVVFTGNDARQGVEVALAPANRMTAVGTGEAE